jgi:methionyl aminopeptidase
MHEGELHVPNYGRKGKGVVLQCGMTFAIEPMINAGRKDIRSKPDGWTIVTKDGSLSAHFEHTVAIIPGGAEILTNGE